MSLRLVILTSHVVLRIFHPKDERELIYRFLLSTVQWVVCGMSICTSRRAGDLQYSHMGSLWVYLTNLASEKPHGR